MDESTRPSKQPPQQKKRARSRVRSHGKREITANRWLFPSKDPRSLDLRNRLGPLGLCINVSIVHVASKHGCLGLNQ